MMNEQEFKEALPPKSADKHKWKNNVCTVCGCKRVWVYDGYDYIRSGQYLSHRPDCMNLKIEDNKTID